MTARIIPITERAGDDQDLKDARTLVEHMKFFSSDEGKAKWLSLILKGRQNEWEYRATMKAIRNIVTGIQQP